MSALMVAAAVAAAVAVAVVEVRVLHSPHPKAGRLPALPFVVLVHGLGGQLAQFAPVTEFLTYYAEVIAIDLPGCGQSPYSVGDWAAYTTPSVVELVVSVLAQCGVAGRPFVVVGHSMGTAVAHGVAARLAAPAAAAPHCIGVVAICPKAPADARTAAVQRRLRYVPPVVFNAFRWLDRRGDLRSASVNRMVSASCPDSVRRLQLAWNLQVHTRPWLRYAAGAVFPDAAAWRALAVPVCLIGAEADAVTPVADVAAIAGWLAARPGLPVVKTVIPGGSHACLVESSEIVCGLINDFITHHVDERLSLGWQLAYLASRDDKWSLKNEAKWRSVQPVSARIARSPFRAMKTLRQDDGVHNPALVERAFPDITDIIDISRDAPPYDPASFVRIRPHKFPTVSKVPPTRDEVAEFCGLVDRIVAEHPDAVVAVHCHYGFNRTGFVLCSYLVARLGFSVPAAIAAFEQARPPGIKHPHFKDELYLRYTL
ncbi:protein-tyrosine phosphatase-like protein [Dipodascopsis tothii]|uniref:protein-tyrosine phosphatase-like protein n=1 Tax=Dipodascopsis tothii TaxID=44089 RepID=UPI0034CF42F6